MRGTMTAFDAPANAANAAPAYAADAAGAYDADLAYVHAAGFGGFAEGLAAPLVEAVRAVARPGETVVDVGCGAGATTAALSSAGLDVVAYEPSADLAAAARVAAPAACVVERSIYEAELPACAAIVALGEPLTYHPDAPTADARLSAFFARAAAAIRAGGLLIFDMILSDGPPFPPQGWASGQDWAALVATKESDGMLERRIETFRAVDALYRRGVALHRVRLVRDDALRDGLAQAGFDVLDPPPPFAAHPLPRRRFYVAERR